MPSTPINDDKLSTAGKSVTLRLLQPDNHAILEVEDHGIGIAMADRPHIFERFYRVIDNAVEGSGLGLAIVREIAGQHNAELSVESCTGSNDPAYPGTLFRLIFPENPASPAQTQNSPDGYAQASSYVLP